MPDESRRLDDDEQDYAINTWRFLRVAMVVLVVGLVVSIFFEQTKANCWQTSISAYYYTPVHGYFVGALVGIGVCLFCLKGNTYVEDVLLNLAGMLAPVVALVPTPSTGNCASVLGTKRDQGANIANNVTSLLVVGALALIILAILGSRSHPPTAARIGYGVAATAWPVAALLFWLDRAVFTDAAHYAAAVSMFACILLVVINNACDFDGKPETRSLRRRYIVIAVAMVAASIAGAIAALLEWKYTVLAIEAALIGLFAVFWVIQTVELWSYGLRPRPASAGR